MTAPRRGSADDKAPLDVMREAYPSVGDRVRYTGSDYSDLFFGPGIVTKISGQYAWVRPTVGGDLRPLFPSGHVVSPTDEPKLYGLRRLEVVR